VSATQLTWDVKTTPGRRGDQMIADPPSQHFLYFLPLPHGHGSLRPIFCLVTGGGLRVPAQQRGHIRQLAEGAVLRRRS
jgi:hypothetical protein